MARAGDAEIVPGRFSLSHVLQVPLSFMVAQKAPAVRQDGQRKTARGETLNFYPWGAEHSLKQDTSPVCHIIRYYLPATDVDYLVAYCMGHMFDGIYQLMTGRDFGAPITELVSKHWPATMALLKAGNDWNATTPALIKIVTSEEQWAVAVTYTSPNPDSALTAANKVVPDLTDWTMRALGEAMHGAASIPGLITVLGGNDYLDRRLGSVKRAIGLGNEALKLISNLIK